MDGDNATSSHFHQGIYKSMLCMVGAGPESRSRVRKNANRIGEVAGVPIWAMPTMKRYPSLEVLGRKC